MIKYRILLIALLSGILLNSQNLVENPSFENTGSLLCSWYTSQAQFNGAITGWTVPTGGSTDIFSMTLANTCYCACLSTHASACGQQVPRTGSKMCNITVYGSGGCTPYREYLQGHLTSSLIPGTQYLVEFYVSFADYCTYATNNLGVYFTTTPVNVSSMCVYNVTPHLNYTGAPITDMNGWVLVSFTYTATAAYNYFMLGNFYNDAATTTVNMGGPKGTVRYFVDDVSITPLTTTPTSDFTVTTPHCDGTASTVTYTGTGTGAATYNWNWDGGTAAPGTGQGPHSVTWPGPGTYNITLDVTEGGNTSTVTTQTVVINPNPTATFTATSPICTSDNSTITYTGSASAGATYTWGFDGGTVVSGSGQGPYQINWPAAGNYNVTLTVSENGCSGTYNVPVTVNQAPTSTFTVNSPVCVGSNTTITYTGTGSSGATYTWDFNGGIVSSGSGQGPYQVYWNTAGAYNVTLTVSENGCSSSQTINSLIVNNIPTSTFTVSSIPCYGDNATITYTGTASSGANYAWDFGAGNVASGSGQGPYQVNWSAVGNHNISLEVTEGGCVSTITQQVAINPDSLSTSVNTSSVSCFSGSNGSVSVLVNGGTPSYTYTWSNGTGTNFLAGSYTVTVTDANGCTDVEPFDIIQPTQLAWTTNSSNLLCWNDNSGMVSIVVNDGTPPYVYNWSNSVSGTNIQNNIPAGTYTVTVTDANVCTFTETIVITEPTQLTSSTTLINNANCNGVCDGQASISGSGGTLPYNYIWSDGQLLSSATSLCASAYTATVVDANGCTSASSVSVSEPTAISVNIVSTIDASCNGLCDGEAVASASGGTAPYFYNWSSGGNNSTATGLCAGSVSVTVTDANGCMAFTSSTINEPSAITAQVTSYSNVTCYGFCDGSATLTSSGGTVPYTIVWTGGSSGAIVNNLCPGTYNVTITDLNGCTSLASTVINQPTELEADISAYSDPSCYGLCDGNAEVLASGGTPNYSYLWTNGGTSSQLVNLCAGIHSVTITDASGCTANDAITLTEPSQITVGSPADMTICNGSSTNLIGTAIGGNPPYQFYWDGQLSNPVISVSPVINTSYTVYAIDVNGCMSSNQSITTIYVTPGVEMNMQASDYDVCPGDEVVITPVITNGIPPYIVHNEQGFVANLPDFVYPYDTTEYIYTVTDQCGSQVIASVLVNVHDIPVIDFSTNIINGCEPLIVEFNFEGIEMQSYEWNFGDNDFDNLSFIHNPIHTYDNPGVYDVILNAITMDGCKTSVSHTSLINVYEKPEARFMAEPEVVSVIKPSVFFINMSALADTNYWSFGDGDTSTNVNPLHSFPIYPTGTYTVELIVATNHGCRDTVYKDIIVKNEYTFYAPNAFTPDFDGSNDLFNVYGNGIDRRNFHIYIYDRWGEVVFETKDINEGWDGRINGGEIGKNGSYTWLVVYKDLQGIEHEQTGAVTIIR